MILAILILQIVISKYHHKYYHKNITLFSWSLNSMNNWKSKFADYSFFNDLFQGFVPAFVRLGPHTVLTFLFFEQIRLNLGYKVVDIDATKHYKHDQE